MADGGHPGVALAALLLFWAVLGGTDADYVLYKDATKPSTHAASAVLR